MLPRKIIHSYCRYIGEPCILQVDDKFFGYDDDPQYPEILYEKHEDAYVFPTPKDAFSVISFLEGKIFKIIPARHQTS